jgi:hypothetical protein
MEKLDPSYISCGNMKWYKHFRSSLAVLLYDPAIPPSINPRELKSCPQKKKPLYTQVFTRLFLIVKKGESGECINW